MGMDGQLILSDHPMAMETFRKALRAELRPHLKPGFKAIAAVNSPMQCMMKEVCAQCLCRHVDSATGEPSGFVDSGDARPAPMPPPCRPLKTVP